MSHVIVVDLGYGDAGKGTVVDWLCSPPARARFPARDRPAPSSGSTGAPRRGTTW